MKKSIYIILLILSVVMGACDKKEIAEKYENPNWTLTENDEFSVSMTVAIKLPENLNPYLTEDDQMVALIGDEVRGIAHPYEGVFYIQVIGTDTEEGSVTFQYWSAKSQYKYLAELEFPFEQDAIHGTPDEPLEPAFNVIIK